MPKHYNDKKKPKATPEMTGTGMARDAGRALQNRGRSIDSQVDAMVMGTYERKGQRDSNEKKKKKGK